MEDLQKIYPIVNNYMAMTVKPGTNDGLHADVFLRQTVGPPHQYLPLMFFLNDAVEGDTCTIHIDNEGGILSTGIALGAMIEKSKAEVTTKALSITASAAAYIFTKGNRRLAEVWGHVMYHTASYLKMGTVKDHEEGLVYIKELIRRIMEETKAEGLITSKDVDDIMVKAKDIFVPGSVIMNRLMNKGVE